MAQLCASGAVACQSLGDVVFDQLGVNGAAVWRFAPIAFIGGVAFLCTLLGGLAVSRPIQTNIGTARDNDDDSAEDSANTVAVAVDAGDAASRALPFAPMTVVWRDLSYSVTMRDGSQKQLLRGISGLALPGRSVALMGASGAGKTTLLDVLAGRKNSGVAAGDVILNGFPKEPVSFARLTAYCEQQDVHSPLATVGEALQFAAALRLPRDTPSATRAVFCAELETLLGLAPLRHRLIGMPGSADGLAPGERKVLTIGVELASNAPILFLDEPTSGLDARAAAAVMRAVRAVAATQRTVVCTIHAPNASIFGAFDDLLLLQRGGWQVYCGPVGHDGDAVVAYLSGLPGAQPLPAGMNAATWMLDVLSGNVSVSTGRGSVSVARASRGKKVAHDGEEEEGAKALDGAMLTAHLQATPQWAALQVAAAAAATPADGAAPVRFASAFATPLHTQLAVVMRRQATSYWRDVGYLVPRTTRLLGLQILFGTVYYKLKYADAGGVSSLIAVMFLSTMFIGMMSVMVSMPVLLRARAVMYRERASRMYAPEVHAASFALIELPWTLFVCSVVVPPMYFMVGLNPVPASFFFYLFVVFVFSYMIISLGHAIVSVVPTADTAVSLLSAIVPVFFLFGGLLIPKSDIPVYWQWLYRLDPMSYAVTAVAGPQFVPRHACSGAYPAGNCPTVAVLGAAGPELRDLQAYVGDKYGIQVSERWTFLGYLTCFAVSSQIIHFMATRHITHMSR
jgi:ABC-type multidrug transport system ATPase subunit/ABC-type multidrug transport system permease subunit